MLDAQRAGIPLAIRPEDSVGKSFICAFTCATPPRTGGCGTRSQSRSIQVCVADFSTSNDESRRARRDHTGHRAQVVG